MLTEALGIGQARLVALCGAGGKTTLMFALAREAAAKGERVLVTTTTRIAAEEGEGPWPERIVLSHRGTTPDGRKLMGHPPGEIDRLKASGEFDRIFVEADGSARRPLKAPAAHEPVVPPAADAVVVIAGMSGLGQPLSEETVFRARIWAALSGTAPGEPVDARSFARVALHAEGLARGCRGGPLTVLFLNQMDDEETRAAAGEIKRLLAASGRSPFGRIVGGCLLPSPAIALV